MARVTESTARFWLLGIATMEYCPAMSTIGDSWLLKGRNSKISWIFESSSFKPFWDLQKSVTFKSSFKPGVEYKVSSFLADERQRVSKMKVAAPARRSKEGIWPRIPFFGCSSLDHRGPMPRALPNVPAQYSGRYIQSSISRMRWKGMDATHFFTSRWPRKTGDEEAVAQESDVISFFWCVDEMSGGGRATYRHKRHASGPFRRTIL